MVGGFEFHRLDVADRDALHDLARKNNDIDTVVHLAAQAGVRHSLADPYAYVQANVMGHLVVLEAARLLPRLALQPSATHLNTCASRGIVRRGQVSSVLPLMYSIRVCDLRTRNSQSLTFSMA